MSGTSRRTKHLMWAIFLFFSSFLLMFFASCCFFEFIYLILLYSSLLACSIVALLYYITIYTSQQALLKKTLTRHEDTVPMSQWEHSDFIKFDRCRCHALCQVLRGVVGVERELPLAIWRPACCFTSHFSGWPGGQPSASSSAWTNNTDDACLL